MELFWTTLCVVYIVCHRSTFIPSPLPLSFSLLIFVWAHFESYMTLFSQSTSLLSLTFTSLSRHIHTSNPCTYVYKHTLTTPTHTSLYRFNHLSFLLNSCSRWVGWQNNSCNFNCHIDTWFLDDVYIRADNSDLFHKKLVQVVR